MNGMFMVTKMIRRGDFSRPKRTATKVAGTVLMLMLTAGSALAFDPPEVLLRVETSVTNQHHSLGDINHDGCDDFVTVWAPDGSRSRATVNIYYGGRPMSQEPYILVPSHYPNESNGGTWPLGRFLPDCPDILVTRAAIYDVEQDTLEAFTSETRFVSLGDSNLGEVLYSYRNTYDEEIRRYNGNLVGGFRTPAGSMLSHPSDFNGDNFNDLILVGSGRIGNDAPEEAFDDIYETLNIFFGGSEFDSIPEWKITRFLPNGQGNIGYRIAAGYDFNGDGYHDMLVRGATRIDNDPSTDEVVYEIYLGGSPMDTIPALKWYHDQFDGEETITSYSTEYAALPDVNGDGYDDWGIYHWNRRQLPQRYADGFYIFFGGQELDIEPDLELGEFPDVQSADGTLIGGDFNEDGIGDILCYSNANRTEGMKRFYFGRREWSRNPEPDLEYRGQQALGRGFFDAMGDYNGDGADDYITWIPMDTIGVVSGWDSGDAVFEPKLPPTTLRLSSEVYPNPFNTTTRISYTASRPGDYKAEIFDTNGRRVAELTAGRLPAPLAGEQTFTWQAPTAGVYIIAVRSDQGVRVVKKAVCLR